eukprot:3676611-Pyramimonas_sp.AAC.1
MAGAEGRMMEWEVETEERESEDGGCDGDAFFQCYGRSSRCVNSQRTCKFRRVLGQPRRGFQKGSISPTP